LYTSPAGSALRIEAEARLGSQGFLIRDRACAQDGRVDDDPGDLARSFNTMTSEIDVLHKTAVVRQELLREAELSKLAGMGMDKTVARITDGRFSEAPRERKVVISGAKGAVLED
jgi:hypothetical protein